MRPFCSIVCCSFNRADLLARSVVCWSRMNFPLERLEIVLVDDFSTDNTLEVFERLDPRIQTRYVRLRKTPGLWRDVGAILNHGIRISTGENICITHPEVMFGRDTVTQFCDRMRDWLYVSAKPYYLTVRDQERIDTVDWQNEGPVAVRKIEGFYDRTQHEGGHPDYTPWAIESVGKPGGRHPSWDSWVVGGHNRTTWKKLGGFLVTERWGSCDLKYLERRRLLGIPNLTLTDDATLCVHQHHAAPRDINKAFAECNAIRLTPESCVYPTQDHLW